MGLLTIIKKVKEKEKELRLLILGLDNAGKTTIVKKFNGEDISIISPTIGFNIQTLEYCGYKLNVWDIGGQKAIRSYWRNYFEQSSALIWCVDSADPQRLELCRDHLHELLLEEKLAGAPLLIFANKQDLPSSLTLTEIHQALELDSLNLDRHWCIVSCSAVTGKGLEEGISWVVRELADPSEILSNNDI